MATIQLTIAIIGFALIFLHPIEAGGTECVTYVCGAEVVKKCEDFFGGCGKHPSMKSEEEKCNQQGKKWECRACTEEDCKPDFTGKCWTGTKGKGYSEGQCPADGKVCASLGCPYDGGIRYAKGCLPDKSSCEGAMALQACKELTNGAAKSTTCATCNNTDLCNKEEGEDQGPDPPTPTTPGSGGTKLLVGAGVSAVLLVVAAIGNVAAAFLAPFGTMLVG